MGSRWSENKLSELIEIIGGGTPKTSNPDYWNGEIPWLSVKDFNTDNRKVYTTEKKITKSGLENSSTKLLNKGDLIISARGTVGALAQLGVPMAFNQSCYGLRANNKTNNDFLYYLLKYKIGNIRKNTHGSVFDTITKNTFEILDVKIPENLNEQISITKILGSLDEKIETISQINRNLEEMARTIFKHWFVDFEFPNDDGMPYKSSGREVVFEDKCGFRPKEWKFKNLNEIVEVKYGKNLPTKNLTESGYPVFGGNGQIGLYTEYLYEKPQVLIGCRGAASGTVLTSLPYSFVTNNSLVLENNEELVTFEYLSQFCFLNQFHEYSTGSAQPQITIANLNSALILVPDKTIVDKFSKIVKVMNEKILLNKKQISKLIAIREALLPKLMSGKVRVPIELN